MIEPVKIGIKANPPSLIFVYKMWGRLRMRTMPIRNLWPTTSTRFILDDIRARHEILLGVPNDTIVKMVDILKSLKAGVELEEAVANHNENKTNPSNGTLNGTVKEDRLNEDQNEKLELKVENSIEDKNVTKDKKEKPYSFMDKKLAEEDTDFDLNDELPLDELDGNSDDDFWR